MESIARLGQLIQEVNELYLSIDISSHYEHLTNENSKLKHELKELIDTHQQKCDELVMVKTKYEKELNTRNKELKEKNEELEKITKISLNLQLVKQLNEKNDYIKILESRLDKYRNLNNSQSPKTLEVLLSPEKPVIEKQVEVSIKKKSKKSNLEDNEPVVEEPVVEEPVKKSKKKSKQEFNPDDFEDVNGFELIIYKNIYYLRDLETNELYNIKDNQPKEVVGLINSKGRVKFN